VGAAVVGLFVGRGVARGVGLRVGAADVGAAELGAAVGAHEVDVQHSALSKPHPVFLVRPNSISAFVQSRIPSPSARHRARASRCVAAEKHAAGVAPGSSPAPPTAQHRTAMPLPCAAEAVADAARHSGNLLSL
jgi:hypothetical protein